MTAWGILGAVSPNLSNWLTPLWLLGVGALCGLVLVLVLWLFAFLASRLAPVDDFDAGSSFGWRGLAASSCPDSADPAVSPHGPRGSGRGPRRRVVAGPDSRDWLVRIWGGGGAVCPGTADAVASVGAVAGVRNDDGGSFGAGVRTTERERRVCRPRRSRGCRLVSQGRSPPDRVSVESESDDRFAAL